MKVLLVALNAKYVHSCLAVYDLAAYARQRANYKGALEVREYTINHNLDAILQMIYKEQADVVAFSCYIWNIQEILSVTKNLSKITPSTRIWLGGPEVSYNSQELLEANTHIDGVIIGEGEKIFANLLEVWESNLDIKDVPGIAYRTSDGEVAINHACSLIDMDEVPFIYDDLSDFDNKIIYYESSRGCPFRCSYCLSSIDKSVRYRSLELVYKELQFFLDNKVSQVKFIDRTFNCDKERAYNIWKYITDNDNGVTNFHMEISSDLLRDKDIELFKTMRPGLIQLEIGLQTTNPDTVREIRRTMDISLVRKNMLAVAAAGNIHQHLDLIAGLPYENYESFKKSFCDAYDMRPDQLQLGFLKVLKGSYMEEMRDEYGLVYKDEQPYEVMATNWITYEEILKLKQVEEMVEVYHNSGQFVNSLKYLMNSYSTSYECFEALGNYYEQNNLFGIGLKREARYEVLRKFAQGVLEDMNVFDELLTYDYYLRDNVKTRPSWSPVNAISKDIYQSFFRIGGTSNYRLADNTPNASKNMHLEELSPECYSLITGKDCNWDKVYCLFDYGKRDPLNNNARVDYLDSLA